VNTPELADTIDAADTLLEAGGCPRDFKVHDQPASVLEVQSFAGRIGGQQEASFDLGEMTEGATPFRSRQTAMQLKRVELRQDCSEMLQCVAVLRKDKGGLMSTPEEPLYCPGLALGA
jgi:hypothetical protein